MTVLSIEPRDSVVARDSRPFGAGASRKMRGLPFPYPQLAAGSLRTLLGKATGGAFDESHIERLLGIGCHGPLLERYGKGAPEVWFPAPRDLVLQKGKVLRLRAEAAGTGFGPKALPQLAFLSRETPDEKPEAVPPYLPASFTSQWLAGQNPKSLPKEIREEDGRLVETVVSEERTHVSLLPETGAAKEGALFTTCGLRFGKGFRMSLRVESDDPEIARELRSLETCHPMGGERRLAFWDANPKPPAGWECPQVVRAALTGKGGRAPEKVVMMLATPGLFANGYLPGWLQREEPVPGTSVKLRCEAAAMDRWRPVSGWSYDRRSPGAKAIRRLAPAGAIYYCTVIEGTAAELAKAWLRPVSDDGQDCRDGYGLALFGIQE